MIRVGIVGCGRMGEVHLRLIRPLGGIEVVGLADPDLGRAKRVAAHGGITHAVESLEQLLERARPNVVHILTPPDTHASLACAALRAGCHVFVEKPLALTAHDAATVAGAATTGQVLTVGHNHLFDPIILEARARADEGWLGDLIGLDVFHGSLPGSPAWVTRLPSGPWMNDASHLLYLSRSFMGDVLALRALGQSNPELGKVVELRVLAQHRSGVSSLCFSAGTVPFRLRLTLFGTKRTLEADLITGTLVEARPFGGHRWFAKGFTILDAASQLLFHGGRNAVRVLTGRERGWPGLRTLIQAFYAAIRAGGASPVPVQEGVRVAELLEEIGRCLEHSLGRQVD